MTCSRNSRAAARMATSLVSLFSLLVSAPVIADDLILLSAGALKAPVSQLLEQRSASLPHVNASYATAGAIRDRLAKGEKPDVLILPSDDVQSLVANRIADSASRRALGETEVGIAVRAGATVPDISTREALRATLLAAKKVVIVDPAKGTSGRLVEAMFNALGVADAMRDKTLKVDGGYVVEVVARGDADLGLHQISEILPVKNVKLVGPLPGDLRRVTRYDAVIRVDSGNQGAAEELIGYLTSDAARMVIEESGFKPAR